MQVTEENPRDPELHLSACVPPNLGWSLAADALQLGCTFVPGDG